MSTLGDQLRTIAAQVDQLQGGSPTPPVVNPPPTPGPGPTPAPPPVSGGRNVEIEMDWNNPGYKYSRDYGGLGWNDTLIVKFTTGSVASSNDLPKVVVREYDSATRSWQWVLSDSPGDFDTNGKAMYAHGDQQVNAVFVIAPGPQPPGMPPNAYPVLQQNRAYYLNVRPSNAVEGDSCNASINLIKAGNL